MGRGGGGALFGSGDERLPLGDRLRNGRASSGVHFVQPELGAGKADTMALVPRAATPGHCVDFRFGLSA